MENCFTILCWFLPYINMNQPQVHTPMSPPASLPIPPFSVVTEPLFEFPKSDSKFPLAIYLTYGILSLHVALSLHLTLSSPLPVSISLFSMSVGRQVLNHWVTREAPEVTSYGSYYCSDEKNWWTWSKSRVVIPVIPDESWSSSHEGLLCARQLYFYLFIFKIFIHLFGCSGS